ncbi:hypothetical protein [Nocardia transvalensis]|uniref:hypothetical protein n=1 Tax=Nocardia transvalensis TaxID=37333 RepID=UPI001895E0E7|nr:hypothetical protein [Nocardia transvalensis]MBF6328711.1 hypothetical protein [Nocardia transvalensis]
MTGHAPFDDPRSALADEDTAKKLLATEHADCIAGYFDTPESCSVVRQIILAYQCNRWTFPTPASWASWLV